MSRLEREVVFITGASSGIGEACARLFAGEGALLLESAPTGSPAFGIAICAVGDIDPAEVSFGTINLHITEGDIPTVSEWGLLVMGLLVLVAGTLVMPRARSHA